MELHLILSFTLASVLLSFMPGPDNIYVLVESITKGVKNGIAISAGLCLGILIHTTAAATGLSIIIQQSAIVFSIVKLLGALYLFYLAYLSLKEKRIEVQINNRDLESDFRIFPLLKKGFVMNVLNPKVSLFFIAFLPQFVSRDGLHITIQMGILGFIFMIQAFVIFSLIAIMAGQFSQYLNHPKFWKFSKWVKAGFLSILGLTLLVSTR